MRGIDVSRCAAPVTHRLDTPAYLFSIAAACIVLMLGLVTFVIASRIPPELEPSRTKHIFDTPGGVNLAIMGWTHALPQRLAHRCMLAAVAVAVSALTFRSASMLVTKVSCRWAPRVITVCLAILAVLFSLGLPTGFEHTRIEPQLALELGIGISGTGALFFLGRSLNSPRWNGLYFALVLILLGTLLAPTSWNGVDLSQYPWSDIEEGWQVHYETVLVEPTDRLLSGEAFGERLVPRYGLVMPVVLAGVQRYLGTWTLGDYVRFAEIMQIVMLALLVPVFAIYTRRRWAVSFLGLVFVGVYFHSSPHHLLFLNLMGWRFVGFPIAFLGLAVAHRLQPFGAAFLLGGVSGFCLLYNLETGIAVASGLVGYLLLRTISAGTRGLRGWPAMGALTLTGISVAIAGFLLLHRVCLGVWPSWESPIALADFLLLFASGSGSALPTFDPLAVVLFGHAVAVVIASWLARQRGLSLQRGMRVVAASIILVWFAYYANHPNAAYLSSLLVPYSILLLDTLRVVMLGERRLAARQWKVGLSLATLALVVIPHGVRTVRVEWPSYVRGAERAWFGAPPHCRLVQGVWLPDDARTQRILDQAEFLRTLPSDQPLVYFTFDNLLVSKQAGVWPELPLPLANPFTGALKAKHYHSLVEALRKHPVRTIYFASWRGLSVAETNSSAEIRDFYEQLRADVLPGFVHRRVVSGWQEWVRR